MKRKSQKTNFLVAQTFTFEPLRFVVLFLNFSPSTRKEDKRECYYSKNLGNILI